MTDVEEVASREVEVRNKEGLHARPVMRFVDMASLYASNITVTNLSRKQEAVDGKSAMEMMLLEATQGNVLCIEARGKDAREAADSLAALIEASFQPEHPKNKP